MDVNEDGRLVLLGAHIPFKTSPVVLACQHADVSPSDAPRVADALAHVALLLVRVLDERGRRLDQQPPVPRVSAHAVCLHGAVLSLTRTLASVSSRVCVPPPPWRIQGALGNADIGLGQKQRQQTPYPIQYGTPS